jgi:iron complex transport system permease protein
MVLVVIFVTLATGPISVSPSEVIATVLRSSTENDFAIMEIGLPRALLAVFAGMAMGVGGALMQAHTRNPLGTPDVIGFLYGASAGAVIALVPLHLRGTPVAIAAVLGGLITAVLVYLFAGGAHGAGYRLIVVGIGMSALLTGVTNYLLSRADVGNGMDAERWLAGSLNDAGWADVRLMAPVAVVAILAGARLRGSLVALETGDDAATGLGVNLFSTQLQVVAIAVLTSAATVYTVGPVAFVGLVAPQVAIRLVRQSGPVVVTSALTGGLLLLVSDLIAQRTLPSTPVPVGIATGVVGGIYLAWLLTRMWRAR